MASAAPSKLDGVGPQLVCSHSSGEGDPASLKSRRPAGTAVATRKKHLGIPNTTFCRVRLYRRLARKSVNKSNSDCLAIRAWLPRRQQPEVAGAIQVPTEVAMLSMKRRDEVTTGSSWIHTRAAHTCKQTERWPHTLVLLQRKSEFKKKTRNMLCPVSSTQDVKNAA
ncbi:hypothetical protein N657DRAFT_67212 [Parathielavia appendiculata]|uniref:Uncharacterized protein n=1 Tax=Parathielavia appendiculata TaxID=2587402 RepID=A0AAN6UA86_9PEZI|nr:hypothetical protein N657DRAFT_67212 [Parathielavia appendiculata]